MSPPKPMEGNEEEIKRNKEKQGHSRVYRQVGARQA
jgi:hypothetical protein